MNQADIKRCYRYNIKVWYSFHKGCKEAHHIHGRIGVLLACPHFFEALGFNHQDGFNKEKMKMIKLLKLENEGDKEKLLNNFIKHLGCQEQIFDVCGWCLIWKESERL